MRNKRPLYILLALVVIVWFLTSLYLFFLADLFTKEQPLESKIEEPIYVALYVGDIDGDVSEEWYFFYKKLVRFYNNEEVPATFSFYPASIKDDKEFNNVFKKMYKSEYIELMQKGYKGDEVEMHMEELSIREQKEIIQNGRNYFEEKMKELTKQEEVKLPISYNQIGARFTNETRDILQSLGFKIYFDVYLGAGLDPVKSTDNFHVVQYGVSFTKSGDAGMENKFKTSQEIFNEINHFAREDLEILEINGKPVIILWIHQQDFEKQPKDDLFNRENVLDREKWNFYVDVIRALENDPNVTFATPEMIEEMMGN